MMHVDDAELERTLLGTSCDGAPLIKKRLSCTSAHQLLPTSMNTGRSTSSSVSSFSCSAASFSSAIAPAKVLSSTKTIQIKAVETKPIHQQYNTEASGHTPHVMIQLRGSLNAINALSQKKSTKKVTKKQSALYERNLQIQAASIGTSVESLREASERKKSEMLAQRQSQKMVQKTLNLEKLTGDVKTALTQIEQPSTFENGGMTKICKPKLPSARTQRLQVLTISERKKLVKLAFNDMDPGQTGVINTGKLQMLIDELKYLVQFMCSSEKREEELYLLEHGEENAAQELKEEQDLEKYAVDLSDDTNEDDEDDDEDSTDDFNNFIAPESDDEAAEIALEKAKKLLSHRSQTRIVPTLAITHQLNTNLATTNSNVKKEEKQVADEDEDSANDADEGDDDENEDVNEGDTDNDDDDDDEVEPVENYDAPRTTRSKAHEQAGVSGEESKGSPSQARRRLRKHTLDDVTAVVPNHTSEEDLFSPNVKKAKKKRLVVSDEDNDQDMLEFGTDITTVD